MYVTHIDDPGDAPKCPDFHVYLLIFRKVATSDLSAPYRIVACPDGNPGSATDSILYVLLIDLKSLIKNEKLKQLFVCQYISDETRWRQQTSCPTHHTPTHHLSTLLPNPPPHNHMCLSCSTENSCRKFCKDCMRSPLTFTLKQMYRNCL